MVLVKNWPFFHVFLGNIGQTNVFYDIVEGKNVLPGYKKLQESKNWDFSKGVSPWFRSKIVHVFHLFIFGNTGQENVFDDILERKNAFLGYKNKKFKKSKNWHFSKGVNPWFWSKNGHFSNFFFLGNIGCKNVFYDILERKIAFLGYKNKKLKKSKNLDFSKGVSPLFWWKIGQFFHLFILGNTEQENVFSDIVERKNACLGY